MKKPALFLFAVIFIGLIWYLFVKPNDYQVNFKVKTFPGTINQIVKTWGNTIDGAKILDQKNVNEVTQQFQFGDSIHIYDWHISSIHDSLSEITVYASDKNHSLSNRVQIPFSDTDFEKRTRKTLKDFASKLNEHIENFKVDVIGEDETRTTFCACTTIQSSQYDKAGGMMKDFPLLSSFLVNNNVKLNGPPFLEVTNWQKNKDRIHFKFCFPIVQMDILPEHPELEYRNYYGRPALKAIYNGNYITSDRAWYALIDYAKKNNIKITELPLEVFYNNPNMGGNTLSWKAEVFMPLKAGENE